MQAQPVFSSFENAETHEFAMRLGTLIDFFFECQNHQLKQSLKAKGPGQFPYLDLSSLMFRTGPCICASLWCGSFGLAHGLPQGLHHGLLHARAIHTPWPTPWPTPGLPLAYPWPTKFWRNPNHWPTTMTYHILEKSIPLAHPWPTTV